MRRLVAPNEETMIKSYHPPQEGGPLLEMKGIVYGLPHECVNAGEARGLKSRASIEA